MRPRTLRGAPATGSTTTPLPVAGPGRPIDPIGAGMKDTWVVKPGEWVSVLGEFADEGVLVSQRVMPGVLEREDFAFRHTTVSEALAAVLDG